MSDESSELMKEFSRAIGMQINDTFPSVAVSMPQVFAFLSTITTFTLERLYHEDMPEVVRAYAACLLAMPDSLMHTFFEEDSIERDE